LVFADKKKQDIRFHWTELTLNLYCKTMYIFLLELHNQHA